MSLPISPDVSPDDWLKANDKWPWQSVYSEEHGHKEGDPEAPFWYWATYLYYDGKIFTEDEIEPEDKNMVLPVPIWNHLQKNTTYPYVKSYWTEAAALDDFRQAYTKAATEVSS